MAKQLTVKAVLQYPEGLELGSSPDVRRFKVDRGTDAKSDLYTRIVDTLPTVFPDLQGLDYSLFYKDEDGEMVEFSSMGELQAALDNIADNVFRVFIIVNYNGAAEASSPSSSDSDAEAVAKRVRFTQAGKRLRKRIRRRRKDALSEQAVQPEFRKAVRLLLRRVHQALRKKDGADAAKAPTQDGQDQATLATLAPETQTFVQKLAEEWHSKLAKKKPRVVARRVRMQKRSFPPGMERDHFQWLVRYLARWHRRNAGKCEAMAGWSSGETGDDTSGDDEAMLRKLRKKRELKKREKKAAEGGGASETETDAADSSDEKVPQDFRKDVRAMMSQLHKNEAPASEGEADDIPTVDASGSLKPEVKAFVEKMASDWHSTLSQKRPRFVAKKIKKENKKSLPEGLEKDAFKWLIKFFKRWHRRNAAKCDAMSGWSSGVESAASGDEKDKKKKEKKKEKKKNAEAEKKEEKCDSSSSSSDSEDEREKEDPVSKEFRKDVRTLVSKIHRRQKRDSGKKGDKPSPEEGEATTLASISPAVQSFVQELVKDWDTKLSQKPPRSVARAMKKKGDALPAGLDQDHFRWIRRFLARWHRKNAGKCCVMSGWSSGETADDTSADERTVEKRRAKRLKRLAKQKDAVSESEDTDCIEKACKPVSAEFRGQVRVLVNQLHKGKGGKQAKADTSSSSLAPEVQEFLRTFVEGWHSRLSEGKRPGRVSREMKEDLQENLPQGLDKDQFTWVTCYMTRWHRKHADKCDVMPAPTSQSGAPTQA